MHASTAKSVFTHTLYVYHVVGTVSKITI